MISNEELGKLYIELFSNANTYAEVNEVLKKTKNKNINGLRKIFCDELLDNISQGYVKYERTDFEKSPLINMLLENIEKLPEEHVYFHFIYHFYKNNQIKCNELIEKLIFKIYEEYKKIEQNDKEFMSEGEIVELFLEPLKEAYNGFWSKLANILRKYPTQHGIPELCETLEKYYESKTYEESLNIFLDYIQKNPNTILIRELTGYVYYKMNMWNNAIAYFEEVEDTALFFLISEFYFFLAYSYGKINDYPNEEKAYRKSLEFLSDDINVINNLGYCLYRQKKYTEAITYFQKCLDMEKDYIYASNNYLRVLIALGRNMEAKKFVESGKYKVSSDMLKRVKMLDNTNVKVSKNIVKNASIDINEQNSIQEKDISFGIKKHQFSNEKLLEDELTAKLEKGIEVFGMKLKIYRRNKIYGRQHVIPIGRIDLLCEDENGNIYIIELKKDSGYDDAYEQIVKYIDWFEKDKISDGKKVYGIICLNSPTKNIIEKVHNDKRIRLFEYQISYTEI